MQGNPTQFIDAVFERKLDAGTALREAQIQFGPNHHGINEIHAAIFDLPPSEVGEPLIRA